MKILFVTFGELSVSGGSTRPFSILRALADAGHQVDVIAADAKVPDHPHIRILKGVGEGCTCRNRLRIAVVKATGAKKYDAVHAIDDAVIFAARLCRGRKIRLIYDAVRCFTGPVGDAPFRRWKWFPELYRNLERKILLQADMVIAPCGTLVSDLEALCSNANVIRIEDIPVQSLYGCREPDRAALLKRFDEHTSSVVVCSILPGNRTELRKVLMASRKIIEAVPTASFFFKGHLSGDAESMAVNLDIQKRCVFLADDEHETFLSALDVANASLLVPTPGSRYVHPEVFTLLHAPAPVVAVQDGAYEALLTDRNSVQVLHSVDSIAEGVLRVIKEPLFSIGLVAEGQQLIADHYSLSSFKHKVRMTYHEVMNKE